MKTNINERNTFRSHWNPNNLKKKTSYCQNDQNYYLGNIDIFGFNSFW